MAFVAGYGVELTAKLGITESLGDVTGWIDQVTGTREGIVPATQAGPRYGDVQLNGFDVLSFNSSVLEIDDGANERAPSSGNFTYTYMLVRMPFISNFDYVYDAANKFNSHAFYQRDAPLANIRLGADTVSADATSIVDVWVVITAQVGHGTGDIELFFDGVSQVTGTLIPVSGDGLTLGSRGNDYGGQGVFDIAHFIEYYNVSQHSQADIDQNVQEFFSEWNMNSYLVTGDQGSYTVTGQAVDTFKTYALGLDQGDYSLTGQDALLDFVTFLLEAGTGFYRHSEASVVSFVDDVMRPDTGNYLFDGRTIDIHKILMLSDGQYNFTGNQIFLTPSIGIKEDNLLEVLHRIVYTPDDDDVEIEDTGLQVESFVISGNKTLYAVKTITDTAEIISQKIGTVAGYWVYENVGENLITLGNSTKQPIDIPPGDVGFIKNNGSSPLYGLAPVGDSKLQYWFFEDS